MNPLALAPLAVPILALAASGGARHPTALGWIARLAGVALEAVAVGAAWLAATGAAPWDGLSVWYLLLAASLGGLGCFASVHYVLAELAAGGWTETQVRRYFLLYHVFAGSLLALAVVGNLLLLWGAVEATTVASVLLVSADGTRRATEAGWKYLIVTSVGGLLALVGLVVLLAATGQPLGTWGFAPAPAHPGRPAAVLFGTWLVVVGFATKAGLVPFHTWLPDAHAEAPAPISALLSGVELAGALYALLRALQVASAAIGPSWPRGLLIGLGLVSLALAAAAMAGQHDMKRLFAYSSIEHMGVVALGLGFGGVALVGALLHVWAHGLAKSGLFYGAGGVRLRHGATDRPRATGVLRSLPLTGAGIAVCAVAIAGLPPFGLFFSEWLVLLGGARAGQVAAVVAAACLLAAGLIALAVRLPDFLLGAAPGEVTRGREPLAAVWPLATVAVASLLVGPVGLVLLHGLPHGAAQLTALGWRRP